MVDLYRSAQAFDRHKNTVATWPLPAPTREVLRDFLRTHLEPLSPGRRLADLWHLHRLFCGTRTGRTPLLPADILAITPTDLETIGDTLRHEARTGRLSRDTFKRHRCLTRALLGRLPRHRPTFDPTPCLRALVETWTWPSEQIENISIERYYTYPDFARILAVTQRPLERALLAVAWETTARPNEYLSLKCGDVASTPHGFSFRAHISKQRGARTRTRQLYVFAFRADFAAFWDRHPYRTTPQAPLFYREDHRGIGQPLGPAGANKILRKYDRLSGARKGGTLYWLRHGGFTHKIVQGMHPDLAGADMGWIPGSNQRKRYTHLTDHDVLHERLRLAGHHYEHTVQPAIQARICPACNQPNTPNATHCTTCGQQLNLRDVLRELEELKANQAALIEHALHAILAKRDLKLV